MTAKDELLKKLKALAERGEQGERDTASKMLKKLMGKYGITENDLNDEKVDFHWFKFSSDLEARLICQIMYMVTGDAENAWINKYKKKQRGCKCTILQSLEIESLYTFYKRMLKKDLKIFYSAFLYKNKLFPSVAINESPNTPSDEELEKILDMAQGMEKHEFRKQIAYDGS